MLPGDKTFLKAVIDATGLFPGEMLDDMAAEFLRGAGSDRWLTAVVEGVPSGLAYCAAERMAQGTWNVLLIAVHPRWHGKGMGSALMRHVEAALEEGGARLLLVETSGLPEFARTRAFYKHIGYSEEARIREFYQAGEDKVVFRKELTARRVPQG